jgi:hypothetical protein
MFKIVHETFRKIKQWTSPEKVAAGDFTDSWRLTGLLLKEILQVFTARADVALVIFDDPGRQLEKTDNLVNDSFDAAIDIDNRLLRRFIKNDLAARDILDGYLTVNAGKQRLVADRADPFVVLPFGLIRRA